MVGIVAAIACSPDRTATTPTRGSAPAATAAVSPLLPDSTSFVIVGRIITIDDPARAT
jgi:hypothetical protein